MPILTLQLPNFPPVEHVLKDDAVTIGRMKGNMIALDDISVSLSHAKLTKRDGDYYLKDLNSTNGTMVNGQSITEVRLRDGDHIKFGEVNGRFYLATKSESPTPPASASVPAPLPVVAAAPQTPSPAPEAVPAAASVPVAKPPVAPLPATAIPAAKKSPWPGLALKLGGLVIVALLLWKLAFQPQPVSTEPRTPSPPPVNPVVPAKSRPPAASPELENSAGIAGLVKSLKSADVAERRRAVSALNAMRTEATPAIPALREALKDTDAEVRMWAALSLISNRVYDKASVPILIQTLQHDNPTLRQVACLSLALFPYDDGDKEPVIIALTDCATNDNSQEVRNAALSALKMVAHEPAAK